MKKRLLLVPCVFFLVLPAFAFGQALPTETIVDGSTLTHLLVNSTASPPHAAAKGNSGDIVGSTGNSVLGGVALAKGNSYRVDADTTLNLAEFYLSFVGTQNLTFYIFDCSEEFGCYTEIYRSSMPVTGTGAAWYSPGLISIPLSAGMYYIIAVSWDGTVDYFFDISDTENTSFGAYVHGYAPGKDPLSAEIPRTINDRAVYHQRITTAASFCPSDDIESNGRGQGVMVDFVAESPVCDRRVSSVEKKPGPF
jgi:hypothetical protein